MSPRTVPTRARRAALVTLSLLIAAVALLAPSALVGNAHAANYTVGYCHTTSGTPVPVYDWVQDNNRGQISDSTFEGCANNSEVMGVNWTANGPRRNGSNTQWRLNVAAGLRVVHWTSNGGTTNQVSAGKEGQIAGWYANGVRIAACDARTGCRGGKVNVNRDLNASRLEFGLQCNGTCSGFADLRAFTNVVTFSDPNRPSGSASGPLTQSGFGRPIRGRTTVTVGGSDIGSGVRYADVQIDGKTVSKTLDQCLAPYTKMQPCPPRLSSQGTDVLSVDTSQVSDGTHSAVVVVHDASGNSSVVWQGSLVVQNKTTVGPGSDGNVRGQVNGTNGGDDKATNRTYWPSTARKPSKRKTVVRRCKKKPYARRHRVACRGRKASSSLTRNYSTKGTATLAGILKNSAGKRIGGATIDLSRQPIARGVAPVSLGTTTTDANGNWSKKVAVAPGSARIVAGYRTHVRDTVAVTKTANLRVHGKTSLRVSRRTVRTGNTVTFKGGLIGKGGSRRGVTVSLQVYNVGRWRAFANPQTDGKGKWHQRYRFTKSQAGKNYRFRARPRVAGTYPYSSGVSSTIRVRVK